MVDITFRVANTQPFIGEQSVLLLGKNGFSSELGVIKPVVLSTQVENSNVLFTVSNLHLLYDDNFNCHIFEARNNAQLVASTPQIPDNIIKFTVNVKSAPTTAGALEGTVGYQSTLSVATSNITNYNLSTNTLSISFSNNAVASAVNSLLLPTPFYVNLFQLIDKRFSSSNTFYISGTLESVSNTHNVAGVSGTANLVLNCNPPLKGLISTYINNSTNKTPDIQYSFNSGDNYIQHNISASDVKIDTVVLDYKVPAIEPGDILFINDNSQTVTANLINYKNTMPGYNSSLYASEFFKVTLSENIASNTGATIFTNITPDLVADIKTINNIANTVTINYDASKYPYSYQLANERVYTIVPFSYNVFQPVTLDGTKLDLPSEAGTYIFQATTINELNRQSFPVTKAITILNPPLGQVTNLSLAEILFRDRTKGVMSRISGIFDHIENRNVKDYEISYKINLLSGADPHPSGMTDFNSFTVSASGVDSNGKIRFTIDNIDLGLAGNTYEMEVKVTPLNGKYRGLENSASLTLEGKTSNPLPLTAFTVSQTDNTLVFEVEYPVDSQENLNELDILHTEIRYKSPVAPINSQGSINDAFTSGEVILLIPHPLTRQEVSIEKIGEGSFTFTSKTVDTSGNKSVNALAQNLSVSLPSTLVGLAAWNESNPSINIISGLVNKNSTENNFIAYTESDNGGFVYDVDPITSAILGNSTPSTLAEDANASSLGFYWSSSNAIFGASDLVITNSHVSYISPIRDLGDVIKGSLIIISTVESTLLEKWLQASSDVIVGVSDGNASYANVLFDADFAIGEVLGFSNSNGSFSYNNRFNTITETSYANTRIFAILNPGQEIIGVQSADDDTSNIFSYALIAGVINAHAIELGEVYYANGIIIPGGNTSGSSAVSNITQAGSSYKIVDLKQFTDAFGSLDYSPNIEISKNVYARFSSANVFNEADAGSSKPHGNVNPSLFDATSLEGNWTKQFSGLRNFRYFQVRVDVDIPNYGESSNAYIDELNYKVLSPRKTFTTTLTSNSMVDESIYLDYSSTRFYNVPAVFCQVLSEGPYIAKTRNLTNQAGYVYIINTQNGNIETSPGIEILISAIGA